MTAGSAGHDPFAVDTNRALDALRLAWGDFCDIGFEAGTWIATRRDGTEDTLTGRTPDELNARIRGDWSRREAGGQ